MVFVVLFEPINLPLNVVFSRSSIVYVFDPSIFLSLDKLKVILQVPIYFILKAKSCLALTNLLGELDVHHYAVLDVEYEPWNDWRNIIPLFQFIFEYLVLKRVFDFLFFPGFNELLEALPLVHHFYPFITYVGFNFEL